MPNFKLIKPTHKSIHEPDEVPGSHFFIRTAKNGPVAPSVPRFPLDLGLHISGEPMPSPSPPGRARGLRMREKRGRARSIGERTREPYYLVANPPLPSLVALSPPVPPLANPPAGCLHSAVPPHTSLYSAVRRAVWLYSAVGQLLPSRLVDTPDRCSSIFLARHGLRRGGGADVR
jgi:hypothetical protein